MVVERLEWNKPRTDNVEEDHEQKLWTNLLPKSWENSITDGFFTSLYMDTVWYIRRLVETAELTTILEIGCGTGQIIESAAQMIRKQQPKTPFEFLGLDINPKFISHCAQNSDGAVQYHVADATKLEAWCTIMMKPRERKTLVVCVNNTLSIMPEEIRPKCILQMRRVAGKSGLVFISYWNGQKFRHGLRDYYKKNPQLCGKFDVELQDFDRRKLLTETGYTSHWPLEHEVENMLRCYGVPQRDILEVKAIGRGIFATIRGVSNGQSMF